MDVDTDDIATVLIMETWRSKSKMSESSVIVTTVD